MPVIQLVLVRHGEAEPKVDSVPDKDRKLVKKGVKQMRRVANFLDIMGLKPERVLSSPYVRAYQSAEVILDELEEDLKIETVKELEPDQEPTAVIEKLKELGNSEVTALLVGHEPHLSGLIKALTGADVELKKGGVAVIEFDPSAGKGKLTMLLTQKVLKRL